jgi:hypothetical protein
MCDELRLEFLQYQTRMEALYSIGELKGVLRDCGHALDIGRMCSDYAMDDETAWQFLQGFPYLWSMFARAEAEMFAKDGQHPAAVKALDEAIAEIVVFLKEHYDPVNEDGSPVEPNPFLSVLLEVREKYHNALPRTPSQQLQAEMTEALAQENYERAAQLRDQLEILKNTPPTSAGKKRSGRKNSACDSGFGAV